MDFISMKDEVKLLAQDAASRSLTILGEQYCLKSLWKSDINMGSYIEKIVIHRGKVYYQTEEEPGKIHNMGGLEEMSVREFYAPSYLNSITLSYSKPQFLTLKENVIKTENPYKHFMVAQHFTKKIYFIASNSLAEGGYLYTADIGKGATEVVAERFHCKIGNIEKFTALAVDQITGDIVLAGYALCTFNYRQYLIESLQKTCNLSEMLTFAGVSSSK